MRLATDFIDKNFKVILIVLIVLIISLFGVGFTMARHLESVSKTGTVSIAKYSLNETGALDLGMIAPGETLTYNFQVSNVEDGKIADVAQEYTIQVITTGNLPLTYTLTGTNVSGIGTLASNMDSTTLITSVKGSFPHTNEVTHSYSLKITWPSDKTESEYLNEVDQVSLSIVATQKN